MSIFKNIKKIISFSILIIFLFGLFTPFLSSAEDKYYLQWSLNGINNSKMIENFTAKTLCEKRETEIKQQGDTIDKSCSTVNPGGQGAIPSDAQIADSSSEKYYYYPLLEKQNYQNATDGGLKCSQDFSSYVGSIITVPAGFNPDQKLLVCWKNNNDYFFYKTGTNKSQHFQDQKSCETSSLTDREAKYGETVKNWSILLGKSITIKDDLKPLYSCNLYSPSVSIADAKEKAKIEENYYPLQVLPGLGETCTADSTGKTTCVKLAPNCSPDPKDPKKIVCTPTLGFAGYLNIMIKIFIGICAVLAMIMIVMGGIQYMTSGLISSKEAAKESITHAILGLLLALGAFAILNTLNPDLLDVSLSGLPTATATLAESAHQEQVFNNLTSNKTFKRTKYYDTIKTLVGNKYPHCIMQAMVQIESGGRNSQIIGHDENVKNKDITSRRDFVKSGKTFLFIKTNGQQGKQFSSTSDVTIPQQNDDGKNAGTAPNPTASDLGLDLRFSHSVGMFGLTFFPPNGAPTDGSNVKMKDIYNNTNNADLEWAVSHAKKAWDKCHTSIGVFNYWGRGGHCDTPTNTNSWNYQIAMQKESLYQQCIAQDK